MVRIGQKVNGATILAIVGIDDELFILANRDNEYISARMSPDVDDSWYWGHYGLNLSYREAWEKFVKRVNEYI